MGVHVGPNGCHWMLCIVLYLVPDCSLKMGVQHSSVVGAALL